MCGCLPHTPTGDLAQNPGMCPDWDRTSDPLVHRTSFNPLSHTSQGYINSFEVEFLTNCVWLEIEYPTNWHQLRTSRILCYDGEGKNELQDLVGFTECLFVINQVCIHLQVHTPKSVSQAVLMVGKCPRQDVILEFLQLLSQQRNSKNFVQQLA